MWHQKSYWVASKDGETIAIFIPNEMCQSYPVMLHGGISATILDEMIGRATAFKTA